MMVVLALLIHRGGLSAAPTYHYEPAPGKMMAVLPDNWSVERLLQLKYRYGFSFVIVHPEGFEYSNAISAGFAPANIIVAYWDLAVVDNLPAGIYYTDEPVEHGCWDSGRKPSLTPEQLSAMSNKVHQSRPGSLFVISGYKRCSHNRIALDYCDAFMYSAYKSWYASFLPCPVSFGWGDVLEAAWVSGSEDQRESWSEMHSSTAFGPKFFMTWINGASDEWNQLFAHANTLALTGIWQFNPGLIDSAKLESYCSAARQNGWLTRVEDAPVPVQLASFLARNDDRGNVRLEWVTLSEINNYGFELERRAGTSSSYVSLESGFVPGNGTTLTPHAYSFVDSTVGPGTWVYRLKQLDLDGTFNYGPEATVARVTTVYDNGPGSSFFLAQNYPNPFNPTTTLQYQVPGTNHVSLKVYDILGKEVTTLVDENKPAGSYTVTFDASGLPSGVYYYHFEALAQPGTQGGTFMATKKLVLLK